LRSRLQGEGEGIEVRSSPFEVKVKAQAEPFLNLNLNLNLICHVRFIREDACLAKGDGLGRASLHHNGRTSEKRGLRLTSQIRRSALSVPGNIAEGFGRRHTKDKLNFYYVSRGSLAETKSHLIYGFKVGYFQKSDLTGLSELVANIWEELNKLINSFAKDYRLNLNSV
jgi:four helix bundle protein